MAASRARLTPAEALGVLDVECGGPTTGGRPSLETDRDVWDRGAIGDSLGRFSPPGLVLELDCLWETP
jgi:hypothetical protein